MSLETYPITTLLSVQNNSVTSSYSSSRQRMALVLVDTSAAVSSSLGIVTVFSGATRDLAMTREQCIWPE